MYLCYANGKIIKAKKVVLALHYPYFLNPYYFPFKGSLEKSYVAACKVDKISKSNGITPSTPILSFRYHADKEKYIIYLNGSHIIQDKIDNEKCFDKLKKEVEELGLKISYIWSNYDIMMKDSLPIVGRIEENLYIATGYNTWGMTNATLAGIIIADLVLNKENRYARLFDPKRFGTLQVGKSLVCNIKGFVKSKVNKNKKFYKSRVLYKRENGKNIAVYKDGNKIYKVLYNCHLGCSLIFNMVEKHGIVHVMVQDLI